MIARRFHLYCVVLLFAGVTIDGKLTDDGPRSWDVQS